MSRRLVPVLIVAALAAGLGLWASQRLHAPAAPALPATRAVTLLPTPRELPAFALQQDGGKVLDKAALKGHWTVVFLGFTHCPDVCPTTLSDFAAALRQLGPDAERVQVIFVTVDPERDTPELLRQFVPAFNPGFLGMYSDRETLRQLAKEFKVVYQKTAVKAPDDYLIDHSAGTYVYDPQGNLRLLMPYGSRPDAIARDLKTLLATS